MKYFTIAELTRSDTATRLKIQNNPSLVEKTNLDALVNNVLDPLRSLYGKPIHVNSGYRCPLLNKKVGGVSTSHHIFGYAADIVGHDRSVTESKKLFNIIKKCGFKFTQLIWEHDKYGNWWVHVSYKPTDLKCQVIDNLLKK